VSRVWPGYEDGERTVKLAPIAKRAMRMYSARQQQQDIIDNFRKAWHGITVLIQHLQEDHPAMRLIRPAALLAVILWPALAIAQAVAASLPASMPASMPVIPYDQALQQLLALLGGLKGATAMAVVVVVVQGLMLALKTPLGDYAGKYKLLAITGLTLVGGVGALLLSHVTIVGALTNATTIAAIQVFIHQIVSQFTEKSASA
jgi:hypothetical protein